MLDAVEPDDLLATIARLETRCEILEAECDQLRAVELIPPNFLGVTRTERAMLALLVSRDFVPRSILAPAGGHSPDVMLVRLRRKLAAYSVSIINRRGHGFSMPAADRERLLGMVQRPT